MGEGAPPCTRVPLVTALVFTTHRSLAPSEASLEVLRVCGFLREEKSLHSQDVNLKLIQLSA